jgi:prepilin-type N-terminal cleavage/methylation domain-containing protein
MRILDRSPSLSERAVWRRRVAFTLIELIVAITIIAVLAGLAVLIIPRLQDSQRIATAAERVQGMLYMSKQMALRDQLPRGIRLWQGSDPNNPYYNPNNPNPNFTAVQFIEQPGPYTAGAVVSLNGPDPANNNWFSVTFAGVNFGNNMVLPGDFLDLTASNDAYCTSTPGAMHYIAQVNPATSTVWLLTAPQINVPLSPGPNYRILRSPRPLIGEKALALPTDVVVYLPNNSYVPVDSDGYYDILFDPSGKLIRAAGNQGKVVLWVGDPTANATAGGDTLVAVYSRTGVITSQPVAPGADPYAFIENGATSGM